jgi:hypothetical protein
VGIFSIRYFYPGSYTKRQIFYWQEKKKPFAAKTKGLKEIDYSFY